jgi:hypothetical protein
VDSPTKLAFDVASVETLRPLITAAGGQVDPAEAGRCWRGRKHVDCQDPEGNVVQLREPAPDLGPGSGASEAPSSPNFLAQDLTNRDFSGQDLRGTSMAGSNLTNARFAAADLSGSCFDGANLTNTDFREATLDGASFAGANLTKASLAGATARSADFYAVNLTGADLAGADLRSANLRGANLMYANVDRVDLDHADLTDSIGSRLDGIPDRMPAGWRLTDGSIAASSGHP